MPNFILSEAGFGPLWSSALGVIDWFFCTPTVHMNVMF